MDDDGERRQDLRRELESLRTELQGRKLSLPAHSIRPSQLLIIEELEEKIRGLEEKVKSLASQGVKERK